MGIEQDSRPGSIHLPATIRAYEDGLTVQGTYGRLPESPRERKLQRATGNVSVAGGYNEGTGVGYEVPAWTMYRLDTEGKEQLSNPPKPSQRKEKSMTSSNQPAT